MSISENGRDPYKDRKSIEFSFRAKRFAHIQKLIEAALAEKPEGEKVEILDLGGSEKYWLIGEAFIEANRDRLHFTLINPEKQEEKDTETFTFLVGDATDPALFAGRTFDVVHSNSVIEHVGDWTAITRFAENTRRLGKRYYMQTPNYWFPYEPHFRFIGFQWLPVPARIWLMTKMRLGFFPRQETADEARFHVESIRLLTTGQVRKLFPDAQIEFEKIVGLAKSILAIRG
jgi:hypothetical protein